MEREVGVAQQQQQHKRQVTRFLGIHQRRFLTRKRTPSCRCDLHPHFQIDKHTQSLNSIIIINILLLL